MIFIYILIENISQICILETVSISKMTLIWDLEEVLVFLGKR